MFVNRYRHVSRLFGTAVEIAIVLWQKVDVVKDVARIVGLFTRLSVTDVHQHRSVEPRRQSLQRTARRKEDNQLGILIVIY